MKTPRMILVALVVCAALGACAGQGTGDGPASSPSGESSMTTSPSTGPANPPTKSPVSSSPIELTGVVEAGVEPGCKLLAGYQLIGGPADVLTAGAKVTVTGQPQPDLMTTCQQGTPFQVESARRA